MRCFAVTPSQFPERVQVDECNCERNRLRTKNFRIVIAALSWRMSGACCLLRRARVDDNDDKRKTISFYYAKPWSSILKLKLQLVDSNSLIMSKMLSLAALTMEGDDEVPRKLPCLMNLNCSRTARMPASQTSKGGDYFLLAGFSSVTSCSGLPGHSGFSLV